MGGVIGARQATRPSVTMITDTPGDLEWGSVRLHFEEVVAGNPERGLAPWYRFRIVNESGTRVGHINFRIGDTRHVIMTAGRVGFSISPEHRGSSFSYHACLALAPFIRRHYDRVILTADPANAPSIRTIHKLREVPGGGGSSARRSGARKWRTTQETI